MSLLEVAIGTYTLPNFLNSFTSKHMAASKGSVTGLYIKWPVIIFKFIHEGGKAGGLVMGAPKYGNGAV